MESMYGTNAIESPPPESPSPRMLVNERLFRLTESSWKSRGGGGGRQEERAAGDHHPSPSSSPPPPTKHAFSLDCIDSNREGGRREGGRDKTERRLEGCGGETQTKEELDAPPVLVLG